MGVAFIAYADENNQKLPRSTASQVELSTWDYTPGKTAVLDEIITGYLGNKKDIMYCPNFLKAGVYQNGWTLDYWYEARDKNGDATHWTDKRRQTGYVNMMHAVLPEKTRVTNITQRMKPIFADTVKAADHKQDFSEGYMLCHYDGGHQMPRGGNLVYTDGHAEWRDYRELLPRYGYMTRLFYWFDYAPSEWPYPSSAAPR